MLVILSALVLEERGSFPLRVLSWDLPREDEEDTEATNCAETNRASQVDREEGQEDGE